MTPLVRDLVARAIADTDVLGDLTPRSNVIDLSHDAILQAAADWEFDAGVEPDSTPSDVIGAATSMLTKRLWDELACREDDARDALYDEIACGNVRFDRNGYAHVGH